MEELNKKWLITGITGQSGSLFADYLFTLGYTNIHGILRRSSTFNTGNINHIFNKLKLHYGELSDAMNIHRIIDNVKPDYIMNFAAMSHVKVSHDIENYTFQVNTLGVLNIITSVISLKLNTRIYNACTSEQFGNQTNGNILLNEYSKMIPVSIYGISKLASYNLCEMYRKSHNMFIVSGILFNHESYRRGKTFVTQKIADYVLNYKKDCKIEPLQLGNLNSSRDWSCAKKCMEAVYLMMIHEKSDNYVICSGETHTVKEFVELAFKYIDITIVWRGIGFAEIGYNEKTNDILVQVNKKYYRDIDIECLIGDSSKAKKMIGWEYNKSFKNLVCDILRDTENNIDKTNI
jgi:GDPmannose 4,6-dehydratase